jgi:hypothetical protein
MIGIIRPHVFAVLLLAFIIVLIFEKRAKPLHFIIATILIFINYNIMLKFVNIPNFTIDNIRHKLYQFNEYGLASGNSHIDLFTTNYFERVFALLFRPLFIDSEGLYQFYVSIENALVLLFTIIMFYNYKKIKNILKSTIDIKFAFISAILITLLISIYIYNLGLASRMRAMIIPYFLYSILLCIKENNKGKTV